MAIQTYRLDVAIDTSEPAHGTTDYGRLKTVASLMRMVARNLDDDDVTEVYSINGQPIGRFTIDYLVDRKLTLSSDGPRIGIDLSRPTYRTCRDCGKVHDEPGYVEECDRHDDCIITATCGSGVLVHTQDDPEHTRTCDDCGKVEHHDDPDGEGFDWVDGRCGECDPPLDVTSGVCGQCGSGNIVAGDQVVITYRPVLVDGEPVVRGTDDADRVAHLPDGTTRRISDYYDDSGSILDEDYTECLDCGRMGHLDEDDVVPPKPTRRFRVAYTGTDTDYEAVGRHEPLDPDMLPDGAFHPDGVVIGKYEAEVLLDARDADDAERIVIMAASYPIEIELVEEA